MPGPFPLGLSCRHRILHWCNPGGLQKHTGAAEIAGDGSKHYNEGYTTLVSTQRVMSVACGRQVLLSQTTLELLQNVLPAEVSLRDLGEHRRFLAAGVSTLLLLGVATVNPDGLPSADTLEAVQGYNLPRTDRNGWIELTTDGEQMWVEVERR